MKYFIKNSSRPLTFIVIVVFSISCSNRAETIQTEAIEENENTIVLGSNESEALFVGLLGNDSVFIKSDIIERDLHSNIVVYLGKEVLYKDENRNFYLISLSGIKIIQLKNQKIAYILITKDDTPFDDKWFILKVYNGQVKETYTVLKEILEDVDNDGFFEVGGISTTESPCENYLCDSTYYTPYKIYKLNERFEFDTILSKKYTIEFYGTFLGFDNYNVDTILQLLPANTPVQITP